MLDAKSAAFITSSARTKQLNAQRKHVLCLIEDAAHRGDHWVVLDDPYWVLFEDDYKFFEALGYKVTRATKGTKYFAALTIFQAYSYETFARIDW